MDFSQKKGNFFRTNFVHLEILKNFYSIIASWISVKKGRNFLQPIFFIWKFWTFFKSPQNVFPSRGRKRPAQLEVLGTLMKKCLKVHIHFSSAFTFNQYCHLYDHTLKLLEKCLCQLAKP